MSVVGDAQRYRDAADGLKGSLRQSFGHAHMAIEFEPEIDENTRDASAGVITDASAQRGIINAARQIEAGEDRSVNAEILGPSKLQAQQKANREKAQRSYRDQLLLLTLHRYQERIDWHKGEIAKIEQDKELVQDHLDKLESGEKPELNEDGSLKDQELEATISAYEKKYGITVDRDDPDAIRGLLQRMDGDIAEHKRDIEKAEIERDAEVARIENMPEDQAVLELQKIEAEKGTFSADAVTTKLDDDVQIAAVEGQDLDQDTTSFASTSALANGGAGLYSDTITMGSQTSGELSTTFAFAADDALPATQQEIEPEADQVPTQSITTSNGMNV
ncbi:hypothetical protein [Citromicrobium bathyomarinum]|uniref:hypothetical protein n=1 Tax=Citromicrobium bathyomarinum TaxID=72174 RepID=UPI001E360C4D|nr:hypothetical protein [Citromicrobium bathyomarinum]MCD1624031.1 hypothetical protein [Citromicrobium bathyomarinum]